jgi:hypothetical protein
MPSQFFRKLTDSLVIGHQESKSFVPKQIYSEERDPCSLNHLKNLKPFSKTDLTTLMDASLWLLSHYDDASSRSAIRVLCPL